MPIPMILTSSAGYTGGTPYSRFGGPIYSGTVGGSDPQPPICAVALIQSTAALRTQLVTTTGQTARSAFVYITQGTLGVSSSNTANIAAAPPYTGIGAALYFDATRQKLSVYSTVVGDWLSITLSSS